MNPNDRTFSPLVPELTVTDLGRSPAFWCGLVGFRVVYDRPEDRFAYLALGAAEVMLDQYSPAGRHWLAGPFVPPLGNGINLQITVAATAPILEQLAGAGWPLFMMPEEKWYRANGRERGQRQFVVADPDGYLLRLAEDLGERDARL